MPPSRVRRGQTLLLALLLAGCLTGPQPTGTANSSAGTSIELVPLDTQRIAAHLAALDRIATEHDGLRTVGTTGYEASVRYVADQLRQMGYVVTTPEVEMRTFQEEPGSTITVDGGPAFDGSDFRAMIYSAGADVTAEVAVIGGGDCDSGPNFHRIRTGQIALLPATACFRRDFIAKAESAGVAAIVVVRPGWERGRVLRPTLRSPDGIDIPVIAADQRLGDALREAATAGDDVSLRVSVDIEPAVVHNVIAETPGDDRLVMVGAHLDSVIDGPGINDNGSGVAAILEMARQLSGGIDGARIRFGFWAAEEYGLLGSNDYVNELAAQGEPLPRAYLNLDMVGSPNAVPFVYDDAEAAPGSEAITDFLLAAFASAGIRAERVDVGGASDHASFARVGVPTGGVFSGANELKSQAQAAAFGGLPGTPLDACYHLACDTLMNVDVEQAALYGTVAEAALRALAEGSPLP